MTQYCRFPSKNECPYVRQLVAKQAKFVQSGCGTAGRTVVFYI